MVQSSALPLHSNPAQVSERVLLSRVRVHYRFGSSVFPFPVGLVRGRMFESRKLMSQVWMVTGNHHYLSQSMQSSLAVFTDAGGELSLRHRSTAASLNRQSTF